MKVGPLTTDEQAALDEYVAKLCECYGNHLVRVVLFGSKARGDSDPESDLDVLVILKDSDWRFRDTIVLVAYEVMLKYGVVLSPLVVDAADYAWWQEHHAPIYRNISAEGIDLWTKQPSLLFESE
jgi:predicted nucleotidyltransferase